jgi:hypothetical protein
MDVFSNFQLEFRKKMYNCPEKSQSKIQRGRLHTGMYTVLYNLKYFKSNSSCDDVEPISNEFSLFYTKRFDMI